MMQTVQKWKVVVIFDRMQPEHVFWIYDNCASNVLRKIADMQFTENGLVQPTSINVFSVV